MVLWILWWPLLPNKIFYENCFFLSNLLSAMQFQIVHTNNNSLWPGYNNIRRNCILALKSISHHTKFDCLPANPLHSSWCFYLCVTYLKVWENISNASVCIDLLKRKSVSYIYIYTAFWLCEHFPASMRCCLIFKEEGKKFICRTFCLKYGGG